MDDLATGVRRWFSHRLVSTAVSFGLIQAGQYMLPFLALPFLSARLGADMFGILLYMLQISVMVGVLVDWGFSSGAVRDTAQIRLDATRVYAILCAVFGAKLLLSCLCICLAACGMLFLPYAREHPSLYWLAVGYGLALGHNPTWFFQGAGTGMRRMAAVDVGASAAALVLTVFSVAGPEDTFWYPLFLFLCKGLAYGWQLAAAFAPYGRIQVHCREGGLALRKALALFCSRAASMTYTQVSVLILGGILPPAHLGVFIVADKAARAIVSLSNPAVQTLFPEICAVKDADAQKTAFLLCRSFVVTALCMLAAGICLYVPAPWIMSLVLGGWREGAAEVLRAFCFMIPLLACNIVLGTQTLVSHGFERRLTVVLTLAGIGSLPVLLAVSFMYGLRGAMWMPALVEGAIFLGLAHNVATCCPQAFFPNRHKGEHNARRGQRHRTRT